MRHPEGAAHHLPHPPDWRPAVATAVAYLKGAYGREEERGMEGSAWAA